MGQVVSQFEFLRWVEGGPTVPVPRCLAATLGCRSEGPFRLAASDSIGEGRDQVDVRSCLTTRLARRIAPTRSVCLGSSSDSPESADRSGSGTAPTLYWRRMRFG